MDLNGPYCELDIGFGLGEDPGNCKAKWIWVDYIVNLILELGTTWLKIGMGLVESFQVHRPLILSTATQIGFDWTSF